MSEVQMLACHSVLSTLSATSRVLKRRRSYSGVDMTGLMQALRAFIFSSFVAGVLTLMLVGAVSVAIGGARAQDVCSTVAGARVVANDGVYLGRLSSEYDSDSIFNKYGNFGSEYSSQSIWNKYGSYGGEYSSNSPFNSYTSTPPIIFKGGQPIAYLSVNRYLGKDTVNPHYLRSCSFY